MVNILSYINELEVELIDESQLSKLRKIKEAIMERSEAEDELWQPDQTLTEKIDAGIGIIAWNSNNLQLIQVMEQLQDAFNETSPMEIINRLKG